MDGALVGRKRGNLVLGELGLAGMEGFDVESRHFPTNGVIRPGPVLSQNFGFFSKFFGIDRFRPLSGGFFGFYSYTLEEEDFYPLSLDREVIRGSIVFFRGSVITSNNDTWSEDQSLSLVEYNLVLKISDIVPLVVFCYERFPFSKLTAHRDFYTLTVMTTDSGYLYIEYLSKVYNFDFLW